MANRFKIDALLNTVGGGKGFVGIYGATATFWNSPAYLQMIGGKFLVQIRTAKVTIPHPMTEDVEDFTIQDRLYIIESGITRWEILAWAEGPLLASTKCMAKGGCIITLWVTILRH